MDRNELLTAIAEAAANVLGVDAAAVTEATNFAEDLDADSLALIEIIMEVEDRIDVAVGEEDLKGVHTVGAAIDLIVAVAARAA